MSRRRKRRESQQSNSSSLLKSKGLLISLGILVSVVLVVVIFMSSGSESQPANSEVAASNVVASSLTASPLTALPLEEGSIEQSVIGRWLRTDGDYYIEITEIDDNGELEAGYYNPYPINVAEAKVLTEANVFMKLEDENYAGSTYTLNYEAENDTLTGIYFHADLQQEFEVTFERLPSD